MMRTYMPQPVPGVSYPLSARPSLNMRHIDGPMIYFRDGQMHWLTLLERIAVHLGWDDAETLERKHRPDLGLSPPKKDWL